jgi:hypothetical protein
MGFLLEDTWIRLLQDANGGDNIMKSLVLAAQAPISAVLD